MTKLFKNMFNLETVYAVPDSMTTRNSSGATEAGTAVKFDQSNRTHYGAEVQFKALPRMRFLQFAVIKEDLMATPGTKIQVLLYDNLAQAGGSLVEGNRIKKQGISGAYKEITVTEHGNGVKVSELALRTSFTDIMEDVTNLLSRDFALYLDKYLRDKCLTNAQVIYARKDLSIPKIANTSTITNALRENFKLSVCTLDDAVEVLGTLNTPMIEGDHFICLASPHQLRGLKDPASGWDTWNMYTNPAARYNGEVGKIASVRFIETTIMPQGANAGLVDSYDATLKSTHADQVPLYKAVLFGEEYLCLAVVLYPELRDDGVEDFGREHSLAWYGIFGADLLYAERGVVIISA